MRLDDALAVLISIKKGTYQKFAFKCEVPIKARYKNDISIVKICFAVGRFGIHYGNLKSIKERDKLDPKKEIKHNPNKSWILKNIVEYNSNTQKYYLDVYSAPNKCDVIYIIYKNGVPFAATKDLRCNVLGSNKNLLEYVLPSYFTSNKTPVFYRVSLDNVLFIRNKWGI